MSRPMILPLATTCAVLALLPLGCPKPTPPTPPAPSVCTVDPVWISSPQMPSEVPEAETFCDFYQFSWQAFLAQVSPSDTGEPVFMGQRVYQPSGGNGQCNDTSQTGLAGVQAALSPRTIKAEDFEEVQADTHALYDQGGNVVHYNAFYSQELCSSDAKGFAAGTLEIKVAWMTLEESSDDFYTIQVDMGGEATTLGLVGIHLAIWTPNHPEMIWASWEHKKNAPLCNGHSPQAKWSFASDDAAACLAANKYDGDGPAPEACSNFEFNVPDPLPSGTVPLTGTPDNVCREYNHGNESGESVNGNDNAANLAAIDELNAGLVGPEGLLTALQIDDPLAVWANYEMVGALWTKDGAESGHPPPVPSKQGPANADSPQRGSLELANMALETFQQGDTSAVPNCFGCHNYVESSPLTVSHIQSKLIVSE